MTGIRINLGSGNRLRDGYVNIDMQARCNPDLVCDVTLGLPFKDGEVEEVIAFDFLEHLPLGKQIFVITEIWRVLKHGGRFEHFTPSTDGRGSFCDPTHLSFWNILSWRYYTDDAHRELYGISAKFEIETLRDVLTGDHIIHTHGIMRAVKNASK